MVDPDLTDDKYRRAMRRASLFILRASSLRTRAFHAPDPKIDAKYFLFFCIFLFQFFFTWNTVNL